MPIQNNSKYKWHILALAVFLAIILPAYWLKSQMGISFFENYSLSKYFPFNYLVPNNIIDDPPIGIILHDSFDSFSLFGNWGNLWMREKGRVTKEYDRKGLNNSRCLVIKSKSTKSWSCSYRKYIRVKEGDAFSFKVSTNMQGQTPTAYAGISTFDEKKEVISWNYVSEKTERTGGWVTLEKTFTIPADISFIRFKLSGTGAGEYRFDNISLKKQP